jgi:hypothetical protein
MYKILMQNVLAWGNGSELPNMSKPTYDALFGNLSRAKGMEIKFGYGDIGGIFKTRECQGVLKDVRKSKNPFRLYPVIDVMTSDGRVESFYTGKIVGNEIEATLK